MKSHGWFSNSHKPRGISLTESTKETGGGGGIFGHSFNLGKTMVLMIHTELERKVKMRRNFKLDIMQPKIQNKSELPAHEYSIPDQFT